MTLILNILWFIFGGWIAGLTWLLAGLLLEHLSTLGPGDVLTADLLSR